MGLCSRLELLQDVIVEITNCWAERGLDAAALARPIGPKEGPWAEYSMAELILHINREVIHHGAEIACIRDLYAHTNKKGN